jgi:uncharacterized membrane-anchored protein
MDWITNHLGVSATTLLVLLGVVAAFVRKPALAAWRWYRAAQAKIHETNERLTDGYQDLTSLTDRRLAEAKRECEEVTQEAKELRIALAAQVRATQVRDDINRQDRALIRAMKSRMRENRIDFADIEESIQQQFSK